MATLIKRRVEYYYINGPVLRAQRLAAGLSLTDLCRLIMAGTGKDYIEIDGACRQLSKQTVYRMERMTEFGLDQATAFVIQKIFKS